MAAKYTIVTWPMSRLIDVLREELMLTGVKEGCGEGDAAHALSCLTVNW